MPYRGSVPRRVEKEGRKTAVYRNGMVARPAPAHQSEQGERAKETVQAAI